MVKASKSSVDDRSLDFDLLMAAETGNLDLLVRAIEKEPDLVSTTGEFRTTLLHSASRGGRIETIAWLLERHADVNAVDEYGGSPLFEAVYNDHPEAERLLRSRGAKLMVPKANKSTSYLQLVLSTASFLTIVAIWRFRDFHGGRVILLYILFGVACVSLLNGVMGLMGKRTFANS